MNARGLAEVVGVLGVMGSLIFVGLEVRQNSVATRASNNATVADAYRQTNTMIASSPDLARAMVAVGEDPDLASAADRILVLGLWRAVFHTWSNVHRQWVSDTLDQVLYESFVEEVSSYSSKTGMDDSIDQVDRRTRTMLWAWESEKFVFNSEFRNFVDTIVETGYPPN